MNTKFALALVLVCALVARPIHADVRSEVSAQGVLEIWITGTIKPGDSDKLKRIWPAAEEKKAPSVYLNSPGGDVDESLKMGRFLRAEHAMAFVSAGNTCASACVFVLMGAPKRIVLDGAKVIIHRPYPSSNADMPFETREQNYKQFIAYLRSYFDEMHFSKELLSVMASVPPETGQVLSDSELSRWGLNGIDPVEQEAQDAAQARKLGISMQVFLERKGKVDIICADGNYPGRRPSTIEDFGDRSAEFSAWFSRCRDDVLHGQR